jgi:hypothetical protein
MGGSGFAEPLVDVLALEHVPGVAVQAVAGVVVDQVEDLSVSAAGQGPVGDVGLPALVRLFGREPHIAGLGALVGLGGDEPASGQDPPDGAHRRAVSMALVEMERDRGRAGLVPVPVEVLADGDDLLFDLR